MKIFSTEVFFFWLQFAGKIWAITIRTLFPLYGHAYFYYIEGKKKKCRSVDLFKKRRELVGLVAKKYKKNMRNN